MNLTIAPLPELTLEVALEIIGGLAHASKMPCYTYSIPPAECNRGSKLHEVEGSVCSKCYARRGNFARPTVIAGMYKRMRAMDHPRWSEAFAIVLEAKEFSGHFRWFAAGDLQSLADLLKIADVARRVPYIKFWLPTHEFGIVGNYIRAGFKIPDNLIIRLSADMIDGPAPTQLMKDYGVLGSRVSKIKHTCPAPTQDNECRQCRKCWDKNVPIVTYEYH